MVILSPHPRGESAYSYPLQDGRPCLQNGACAASNSFTLPPFSRRVTVPPSRSSFSIRHTSLSASPPQGGRRSPLRPSLHHPLAPARPPVRSVRRFFSLRCFVRPSLPSTPPVPSLDHPDLPFLSLDHSDRSRNKCYPHLPHFPFSSVTSMIILRPAINREK